MLESLALLAIGTAMGCTIPMCAMAVHHYWKEGHSSGTCVRMLKRRGLSPLSVCEDLDAYVELRSGIEDTALDEYAIAAGFGLLLLLLLGLMVRCASCGRAELRYYRQIKQATGWDYLSY